MLQPSRIGSALLMLALIIMALPTTAQELSGTPAAICDAAQTPEPETREYGEAEDVLEAGVDYRAIFCTDVGAVYVDLYEGLTPLTVNNFVFLSQNDYYNNTIFHRVLEDFMVQGGDPTGTGSGGPGYRFGDEFISFLGFEREGLLAMANAGPATNGSQFFITTSEPTYLNGRHTIFGEVLEGQDVVESIMLRDPQTAPADAPATMLNTIVIVTEPETVETTYEAPEAVEYTADDFVTALATLNDETLLPPDLLANFQEATVLTSEEAISAASEDAQEALTAYLGENHTFRVVQTLEDSQCVLETGIEAMTYTVDAFASIADADAAFNSEERVAVLEAAGYTLVDAGLVEPFYARNVPSCGEGEALQATVSVQRGSYIATATLTVAPAILEANPQVADALSQFVDQIAFTTFESPLGEIYLSAIR